jgi:hypothetical protein
MAKITLDIPDELIDRFAELGQPITEWLPQQLPSLLTQSTQLAVLPAHIYRDILNFIASGPTPQQTMDFRPTPAMQDRLRSLVDRAHSGDLTPLEQAELDEYERIEHIIIMLKAGHC